MTIDTSTLNLERDGLELQRKRRLLPRRMLLLRPELQKKQNLFYIIDIGKILSITHTLINHNNKSGNTRPLPKKLQQLQ